MATAAAIEVKLFARRPLRFRLGLRFAGYLARRRRASCAIYVANWAIRQLQFKVGEKGKWKKLLPNYRWEANA